MNSKPSSQGTNKMCSARLETSGSQPLCCIVTPIGMLGYGFDKAELSYGIELSLERGVPTAIILDSGSTDGGPEKLALGGMTQPRSRYTQDLIQLIDAVCTFRVPLLIGSAGGDGSNAHVDVFLDIITEILNSSKDKSKKLKIISIYSNIDHTVVMDKLAAGKISGCGPCVPPLTSQDVEATPTIVAQMGPEPFVQAMDANPDFDIIIGGRAYDPAPYVAFCAFHAFGRSYQPLVSLDSSVLGGFTHMGKIMECGGVCATPKSASSMATIYDNGVFDVRPLKSGSLCTPMSVAAHTLYEKTRPDQLHGPGGYINLLPATYNQLSDDISVRVQGTLFTWSKEYGDSYTVKLEGAKLVGYRTIFFGSFADPILILQLPNMLETVKEYVAKQHDGVQDKWELGFHIYGRDQLVKNAASSDSSLPFIGEVCIVGEALADTQTLATSVAATAKVACIHGPYKGQKATSGNFGMGIGGKAQIDTGPCAEFSVYHLMDLDEGCEEARESFKGETILGETETRSKKLFRWETHLVGTGDRLEARPPTSILGGNETQLQPKPISPVDPITSGGSQATTCTLGDAAKVIRSKNAGPFEITMDVMFDNKSVYEQIKKSGILQPETIAQLYGITVEDIVYCGFFDQAQAFKVTIPRMRDGKRAASGGYMENDVHGSQKYLPLLNLKLNLMI